MGPRDGPPQGSEAAAAADAGPPRPSPPPLPALPSPFAANLSPSSPFSSFALPPSPPPADIDGYHCHYSPGGEWQGPFPKRRRASPWEAEGGAFDVSPNSRGRKGSEATTARNHHGSGRLLAVALPLPLPVPVPVPVPLPAGKGSLSSSQSPSPAEAVAPFPFPPFDPYLFGQEEEEKGKEGEAFPSERLAPEQLYCPGDVRFWAYSVGKGTDPRSYHGGFGHGPHPRGPGAAPALSPRDLGLWRDADFVPIRELGRGCYGTVALARERVPGRRGGSRDPPGHYYALKAVAKAGPASSEAAASALRREVEVQTRLSHPNVLRMAGYYHHASAVTLVLEWAGGGDLHAAVREARQGAGTGTGTGAGGLPHAIAARFAGQIAAALSYLRERDVAHRDVKPENVLLTYAGGGASGWGAPGQNPDPDQDPVVPQDLEEARQPSPRRRWSRAILKLCDFGGSCHCPAPHLHRRTTLCGTPDYIAPEMVRYSPARRGGVGLLASRAGGGQERVRQASQYDARYVDTWALGILIFEMVSGRALWNPPPVGRTDLAARRGYANEDEVTLDNARNFADSDLDQLGRHRGTSGRDGDWGDLLRALLRVSPTERIGVEKVKRHPWCLGVSDVGSQSIQLD